MFGGSTTGSIFGQQPTTQSKFSVETVYVMCYNDCLICYVLFQCLGGESCEDIFSVSLSLDVAGCNLHYTAVGGYVH